MSFSIIHLSDLHYKNDYPCIDRVKRLKSDILNNIQDKCYLIFSGDLVFSGKNDEYEGLIDEFCTDIYDNFEKIYLVPGNHDIDWELTDPTKCKKFSSDIEQNYLYPQNSKLNLQNPFVKDPLTEYHFFQELISKYQETNFYGSFDTNSDFNILGLNSTWLSYKREASDTDRNKLILPPAAIEYFSQKLQNETLKICTFHHPLEWISEDITQRVLKLLTENFDLVLFGHKHNRNSISGNFNNNKCCLLQAPALKDSSSSNSYTIIRVDNKYFEFNYRCYSDTLQKFVVGEQIVEGGVDYPNINHKKHWDRIKNGTKSGLLKKFQSAYEKINFQDWYNSNIIAKSNYDDTKSFVEPLVTKIEYQNGESTETNPKGLTEFLGRKDQFQIVTGPQDSGLTTAAFLTFKSLCTNFEKYQKVPVYINLKSLEITKGNIIRAAIKTAPIHFSYPEMKKLIEEGGVVFIFDQIGLPETEKLNKLKLLLEKNLQLANAIVFCSDDGGLSGSVKNFQLNLDPLKDTQIKLKQLDVIKIRDLIRLHKKDKTCNEGEVEILLQNVVQSFKQMDEPIYPSTVVVLLDTLKQFPEFLPINRVRLLDRYIECLLGRFEKEDIEIGTFNSTEKVNLIAYIAGHFARKGKENISIQDWDKILKKYKKDTLLELPSDLLEEFSKKGILITYDGKITFRADYLFSYFVAKEMNRNNDVYKFISEKNAFYRNHRELVYFGELEGIDSSKLLKATKKRLIKLEKEILETYSSHNINFNEEWDKLMKFGANIDEDQISETLQNMMDESPNSETIDQARTTDLSQVNRKRGVRTRSDIKELELCWFITIKTYFQLIKHSTNLDSKNKLIHLKKSMESSELFIKCLATKRAIISSHPMCFINGILYINPLAAIDPKRAKSEFKVAVHLAFARVLSNNLYNSLLSPAFRKLIKTDNEIAKFFVRHLLLEDPNKDNIDYFVKSLSNSTKMVLIQCSLQGLYEKYLGYSITENLKDSYQDILHQITKENKSLISTKQIHRLKRKRLVNRNRVYKSISPTS